MFSAACGSDGPTGSQGVEGATGPKGSNGTSGETTASKIICQANDSGSGLSLIYTYESVSYSNGDRLVIGTVSGSVVASTETLLYSSTEVGATTGGINVVYDVDSAGGGYWTFTSESGVTKTVYNDVTSAHNGYTFAFTSGNCLNF